LSVPDTEEVMFTTFAGQTRRGMGDGRGEAVSDAVTVVDAAFSYIDAYNCFLHELRGV
jgi:hypothetical protein